MGLAHGVVDIDIGNLARAGQQRRVHRQVGQERGRD
jgi:hypothetical protein